MPLAVPVPLGAIVTGFVLVVVPVLILMAVWAGVTAVRILFPERPLPFDPVERRRRETLRGRPVTVRARDILEDQALRHAEPASGDGGAEGPAPHPFTADLWLRRN